MSVLKLIQLSNVDFIYFVECLQVQLCVRCVIQEFRIQGTLSYAALYTPVTVFLGVYILCSKFEHKYLILKNQARIQGGRSPVASTPPPGALREGPGGATMWLNNCQKSLKTRLKYIKITLKFDSYNKNQTLALIECFQIVPGGPDGSQKINLPTLIFWPLWNNPVSAPVKIYDRSLPPPLNVHLLLISMPETNGHVYLVGLQFKMRPLNQ